MGGGRLAPGGRGAWLSEHIEPAALVGRPESLAVDLLGCHLSADSADGTVVARIVEVEAYAGVGEDPGSHAHRGLRRANATMFGRPGLLYVYFVYGMHWCANIVVHEVPSGADEPVAGAVLVRAADIVSGGELARVRRGPGVADRDLARGPARLTTALGIDGTDDGIDVLATTSRVRLSAGPRPGVVGCGPRVGVSGDAADTPWRWWDQGSSAVSVYRRAVPRRRVPTTEGPV